ncbi:uncharacterized protein [Coffea arabica]|uniref:Uncharacterized protein LOC113727651 n=1 Tax=Coffea arabica TaxID=13443 RepID=A0A6P6VYS6_COFAR|nr:uncharacterized protein LOC113727651 [Coffea arabica]XP_027107730.1 uncharacterized protein LOC113727651 [Coffea arabica]XP_027107731.1 uncharacterized protein LOC113727651 [Coffea arabica]
MGKGARNKRHETVTNEAHRMGFAVVTDKDSETEVASIQQVDAKIEALTNRFDSILGVVKNMSMQLEEISCGMKGLMNKGKKMDACGISTREVSDNLELGRDIIGEFHNLKQTGSVAEYQEKFAELRDLLMTMNYGLTEDYFISSFLSGLKEEIRHVICKPKPETLIHAFNLARIQEIAIEVMKVKLISSEMRTNREQILPCESVDVFIDQGHPAKFKVSVGERDTTVIISTGVPYSFIDTDVAIQAGFEMEETTPLLVNFVFGLYQAVSRFRCPSFRWTVQGHEFVTDMRIVEIRACDMVLGGDWVSNNYPLTFTADRIVLLKGGKEIVLLDKTGSAKPKMNKGK